MEYIARISFSLMILLAIINIVQAEEVGIRSDIHDISENNVTWNYYTFPGFYYDLDNDIGTETLSFQLLPHDSNNYTAILSDQIDEGIRGAIYETKAFNNTFSFDLWGQYDKIDFLGKDYFAGYNSSVWSGEVAPVLYNKSKNRSLMQNGQLSEILWDDNTENTIDSSTPLDLDEGYRLAIKALDADGKKVYLELTRSNKVVDSKVVSPSIENATVEDATYYYKKDLGATKDIVLLAVHFKNAFRSDENNVATIDGVFQISEKPISISTGQQYGEMSVRSIDPVTETIILDNKDRPITLSKNKDIKLMGDIYIRTADQSDSDNPLRYYLYYNKSVDEGDQNQQLLAPITQVKSNKTQKIVYAKQILDAIKNGERVDLNHSRVEGDLNLNNLGLVEESVDRNPYEEDLGLSEAQKVVTSFIRINDTKINGTVNFKNTIFERPIDFKSTEFKGRADFMGSDFRNEVRFENATFHKKADFRDSLFHNYTNFYKSTFDANVSFDYAWFNDAADFSDSRFNEIASFIKTIYNGDANFEESVFNDNTSFSEAKFNSAAYFWNSSFKKRADISYSEFSGYAGFDNSTFNKTTTFEASDFNGDAYFMRSVFDRVDFNRTWFDRGADFSNSNFSGPAYFFGSYLGNRSIFSGIIIKKGIKIDLSHAKIENLIADWQFAKPSNHNVTLTIGVLQNLRGYYERYGSSDDANDCYFELRKMKAGTTDNWLDNLLDWLQNTQKIDYLARLSYGYGVRPLRPLEWSIIIIVLFAVIFWQLKTFKLGEAIYFSLNAFVSGTGKIFVDPPKLPKTSTAKIRFLFLLERILGLIFISLLVIAFTKTVFLNN